MTTDPSIQFLRTLSSLVYDVHLSSALRILDAAQAMNTQINQPDLSTHAGLVAFARARQDVMSELPDRKIQAIKNLRAASGCGLVEAKRAVDEIVTNDFPTTVISY